MFNFLHFLPLRYCKCTYFVCRIIATATIHVTETKIYLKKLSNNIFLQGAKTDCRVTCRLKNQGFDEIQIYGIFAFCWLKRALRIKFYFCKRIIERHQP